MRVFVYVVFIGVEFGIYFVVIFVGVEDGGVEIGYLVVLCFRSSFVLFRNFLE